MNQLEIFEHPEFGAVRTMEIDGEPWLVGKDVAQALGYNNTRDAPVSWATAAAVTRKLNQVMFAKIPRSRSWTT